jgi:GDP-L-fucose synthase
MANNKVALITGITGQDGSPRKLIDISRLSNMGWNYSVNFKDGVSKTYKWFFR